MSAEQMSTGKIYAALISRLESDKEELERERNFLKKELAIQAFRNRKLEKEIEELRRGRQQNAPTRRPKSQTTIARKPVESIDSDSDDLESTSSTDTELEQTPTPSACPSPEMRPVTTPQPVLPLWMAIAEETIPEQASSSHEITAPQPHPFEKDNDNWNNDDIITNSKFYWDEWAKPEEDHETFYKRGELVELPGGVQTTFGLSCEDGTKIRLIKPETYPDLFGYMWVRYGCRLKCVCGECRRGMDSVTERLTIVGDELRLDGGTEEDSYVGRAVQMEKDLWGKNNAHGASKI